VWIYPEKEADICCRKHKAKRLAISIKTFSARKNKNEEFATTHNTKL
jgi:hypothetical protein